MNPAIVLTINTNTSCTSWEKVDEDVSTRAIELIHIFLPGTLLSFAVLKAMDS